MAVLVALPLIFWVVTREFSSRAVSRCGLAVASAALLLSAAVAYDHWTYEHDPRWHGFRSFNQLRGQFHDGRWTYYTAETARHFSKVGWSENDHAMIANWFSDDPVLYDRENLSRILQSHPWKAGHSTASLSWQAFRTIAQNRSVLSVLLVLPFVLTVVTVGRQARLAVAGSALAAVALLALVTWNKKLPPERVYFPLMTFPLSVTLLSFAWKNSSSSLNRGEALANDNVELSRAPAIWQRQPRPTRLVLALLVIGTVMGLYRQGRQSVRVHGARGKLQSFLNELRPAEHKLIVSWEAALPYELVSPLDSLDSWCMPLLSLAWTQRTPWHEEIKRQFGISNIAQAICQRDDIVLVATPLHRELFAVFAKEHFQSDVEFVPLMEVGQKFVAGRFRQRGQVNDQANTPADRSRY